MRFYIIAGEASGDLHASNLIKELKRLSPEAEFRGFGGDMMEQQGMYLVKHFRETAFMGFAEVIRNLRKILQYIDLCKKDMAEWNPDAIVLVDYPGFNLRIAEFAKKAGFKVFYYISPQVWAWKASRVKIIRRYVDKMFVILPFEKDFYRKWNYEVDFVGHPLLDALDNYSHASLNEEIPIIALLPGSRKQEIGKMLPVMLDVIPSFPDHRFVVAGVNSVEESFYDSIIRKRNCKIVYNQTYSLLSHAKAALVTSGTATLETALFKVPEVVCYKGSFLSYSIGKRLVDVKYISLVNLVLDKPLVRELIQSELTASNLTHELNEVLFDAKKRKELMNGYLELREKLGGKGASEKTARKMLDYLQGS